jgi:pimeloyl-ACP methyl ester carboxylesterase
MLMLALFVLTTDPPAVHRIPVAPAETLSVTVVGTGSPVVFLPGLFGSAYGFRKVMPILGEDGFQSIVVEPLGIGASGRPRHADYSLTAQATRVAAVLDTLGITQVIVAAHSVSAAIAYRLAILRPDLVAAIVSLEGGPVEEATTPGFRRALAFAPLLKLIGGKGIVRGKIRGGLEKSSGDASWVTDEIVEGYTADALSDFGAALDAFKGMAESPEPWPLRPRLSEIYCPVRLVLGGAPHQSGVSDEEIHLLRRLLPLLAIDSIPNIGHFAFEEDPGAVALAVMATRRAIVEQQLQVTM